MRNSALWITGALAFGGLLVLASWLLTERGGSPRNDGATGPIPLEERGDRPPDAPLDGVRTERFQEPAAKAAPESSRLALVVLTKGGDPVVGARVRIRIDSQASPEINVEAVTDSAGGAIIPLSKTAADSTSFCNLEIDHQGFFAPAARRPWNPGADGTMTWILEALVLDLEREFLLLSEAGERLNGVELLIEGRVVVRSNAAGIAIVALPRDGDSLALSLRHPGHAVVTVSREQWIRASKGTPIEIRLPPEIVLSGRIEDEAGSPIARARISPHDPGLPSTRSGDSGSFLIKGLNKSQARHGFTVHHDAYEALAAEITSDEAQSPVVWRLRRGVPFEGEVLDFEGAPCARAEVVLVSDVHDGFWQAALADDSGRFRFVTASGPHRLHIVARSLPSEWQKVEVPSGGMNRTIRLRRPFSLAGRVLDHTLAPIRGARVQAVPKGSDHEPKSALSDDNGRFVIEGLPEGSVELLVHAVGFLPGHASNIGVENKDVEILLLRAARIELELEDSKTGASISDFDFHLLPSAKGTEAAPAGSLPGKARELRRMVKGASGRFTTMPTPLQDLRSYRIEILAKGYRTVVMDPVVASAGPSVRPERVALERGAVIRGIVLDADTGEPIEGALITEESSLGKSPLTTLPIGAFAVSDLDGRFHLEGAKLGSIGLVAVHEAFLLEKPLMIETTADLEAVAELRLRANITLKVILEETSAADAEASSVECVREEGGNNAPSTVRFSADGVANVPNLGRATYTLLVKSPVPALNGQRRVVAVEPPGMVVRFQGRLEARIVGEILIEPAQPLATPVDVEIERLGGEVGKTKPLRVRTDESGHFFAEGLEPGPYRLSTTYFHAGRPFSGTVELELLPEDNPLKLILLPAR